MKALRKEFWMEIRKSKARFISIFLIVTLGVAFFSGIQASSPDMRYSGDAYYDEKNLMDIKVVGTMGLTQEDVEAIQTIDGVETAEGAYSVDVMCGDGESQKILHIESVNEQFNTLEPEEGRIPQESGELYLDSEFAASNGYEVGDTLFLREGEDSQLLVTKEYTIVGIGRSPLYISFNRGNTTLGSGEVNGFAYVLPQDFDQEVYTQIYVMAHGSKELTSYMDDYDNLIEKMTDRVEGIAKERCEARLAQVKADAQEEIDDAARELEDGKKEANEKLADARQELVDAQQELEDGKKELEDGEKKLEDSKKELEDGGKEIQDAWADLAKGKIQINEAKKELEDGRSQLADARQELTDGKNQLADAKSQIASGWSQVESARNQLVTGQAQIDSAQAEVDSGLKEIEASQKELDEKAGLLEEPKQQLADGKDQIEQAKATLNEKQAQLDASKAEIASGREQLETTKAQLNAQRQQCQEGLTAVEQGEAQLAAGETSLAQAREQLAGLNAQLESLRAQYNAAVAAQGNQTQGDPVQGNQTQGDQTQENQTENQGQENQVQEEGTVQVGSTDAAAIDALAAQIAALESQAAGVQEQINTSSAQLEENRGQLAATRSELEANIAAIDAGLAQAAQKETELTQVEDQLAQGQAQVDAGWSEISTQEATLASAQEEIDNGEKALAQGQAQIDAAKEQLASGQAEISANMEEIRSAQAQIDASMQTLYSSQQELEAGEQEILSGEEEIRENEKKLADGEEEIRENEKKLADGAMEIRENEKKLADGQQEIEDGEKELADARKEIEDGEKELADGWKEYEDAEKEAEEEIAENEQKLADAEKELDDLKAPEWMVTDRNSLPEYSDYGDNADRIRNIGQVFPVIFFLVAALISLTTMTRMVEEQRTQIGTLKALGYGKGAIAAKYICYALLATVGGSIAGILVGEKVIPYVIITAYGIMYHNVANSLVIDYEFRFALIASIASIVCTVGATLFSCSKALKETPASLMRPPAPKEGKRVLLERIPIIWKHLSFSWKSTLRNLFRYKKRLFMTIFGIAGSMGLMLVGFGIRDSISDIVEIQYEELQHYEGMVILDEDATEEEKEEACAFVENHEKVAHSDRIQLTKLSAWDSPSLSIYVYVPENLESFRQDVTLQNRITKEQFDLTDEGAVISEKTASLLKLEIGDEITLEKAGKEYSAKVAGITENYMSHYVYMTPAVYEETFGEGPVYEDVVFTMKEEYKDDLEKVGEEILTYPGALSISYTSSLSAQIDRMLSTLGIVIIVLIVSAGMLAFVVLYNLNNINITERQRELATLKVLGFYDGEVSQYVFRENILLTVLGVVFGIILGIGLHQYTITTVEVDSVMFGRSIKPLSFAYSTALTCGFSAIVNIFMHFKLKKIDMVESLKSVE